VANECLKARTVALLVKPADALALTHTWWILSRVMGRPGLRPVEALDDRLHERYEMAAVDIRKNPYQTPHMAVRDGETVFTSVVVFLERVGDAD